MKDKRGLIKKFPLGNFKWNLTRKIVLFLIIIFSVISLVYASMFIDKLQSQFDLGTYNNTLYNASVGSGAVQINLSYNNGTYTSKIFNTGSNVTLNNLSWTYQRIQCSGNMSYINKLNGFCIDKYEAHVLYSNGSIATPPTSTAATDTLIAAGAKAGSAFNQTIWVYIDQTEARTACSNAGKHLCTREEWLAAANLNGTVYNLPATLSASPYYCVVDSTTDCAGESPGAGSACKTGGFTDDNGYGNCFSTEGVYDLVGNVLEWTNETVDTIAPGASSAVYYFNGTGWQVSTSSATTKYGNDGTSFLGNSSTGRAVIRGGAWSSGADAGLFCASLYYAPAAEGGGIGFRCCSS